MVSEPLAVAGAIRRIYAESEARLFELIAARLARGIDSPGWAAAKAAEILLLRRELEREIVALARASGSTIADVILGAYSSAERAAGRDLGSGAIRGSSAAIRVLARETVGAVSSTHLTILRTSMDIYRSTVAEAAGAALTGASTRRAVAARVLDRFAMAGITGFVDTAGRSWEAASYAEMATRTAIMRASVAGYADTIIHNEDDLVIVSTSPRPCPKCYAWEGRVLSLTGTTSGYPTLDEATGAGLHHPNCGHREHLYTPGVTRRAPRQPSRAESQVLYEEQQRQREIERHIREWKRREAAALEPVAKREASTRVRQWQAAQREHLAGSDLPRRYDRESVVGAR